MQRLLRVGRSVVPRLVQISRPKRWYKLKVLPSHLNLRLIYAKIVNFTQYLTPDLLKTGISYTYIGLIVR